MNYWQRKTLAEEARVNALAGRVASKQKRYLQQANIRLKKEIAALQAEILANKETVTRTTLWRYGKYVELQDTIEKEIAATGVKQIGLLDEATQKVFETRLKTALDDLSKGRVQYQFLKDREVGQAIRQVWNGADFSQRVWNNTNVLASRVKNLVDESLVLGRSPQQLSSRLQSEFGTGYSQANRLIRTELSHTFNTASMTAYKAAGLTKVRVLVSADERLCPVCGEAEGEYTIGTEPMLPLHPHCRCCYAPVTDMTADEEMSQE